MGNRALGRLVQAKLTVSHPADPHEQQAERVADEVLRFPDTALPPPRPAADAGSPSRPMAADVSRVSGGDAATPAGDEVDSQLRAMSGGQPLDAGTRSYMEPRFGADFSSVRVHTGPQADRLARSLQAEALTVGTDVVFRQGGYAPDTDAGKRLLAHELTHVVQQEGGARLAQRLIRTPYPWDGVITPTVGANIRSSPDATSPANILDSLPQGQLVRVLSATGSWLRVESRYRGPALTGYVLHTLVDDAAASSMAAMVGTTMVWRPSGPGSGTTFESWASAATETPFPPITAATRMNCWEAVLLAAHQAGTVSWAWIHNLYVSVPTGSWVSRLTRGARRSYAVPGPNAHMPQRGDLVFFNGLAHVALATGSGSDVYTFWPPPNTPFTPGGTTDKVKTFTIEALVNWWKLNLPPAPAVEFAAPSW